jgi:hypothetical protein
MRSRIEQGEANALTVGRKRRLSWAAVNTNNARGLTAIGLCDPDIGTFAEYELLAVC